MSVEDAISRAIPIYAMGGLSGAMYKAESVEDTEALAVDVADWNTIVQAARLVADAQTIVDEQAEDEALWFHAVTAPEAYLQQELRRLHAAIETTPPGEDE